MNTITLDQLPALGADLNGGTFAGMTTRKDGTHCAVVLLHTKPSERMAWADAIAWAKKQGGELPSRPVAALLFANVKDKLELGWHWTSEEDGASYAWHCNFYGGQNYCRKGYEGWVVAVRLIPVGGQ